MTSLLRVDSMRLKSDFASLWAIGGNRLSENVNSEERRVYQRQALEWLRRRLDSARIEFHSDDAGNVDACSDWPARSSAIVFPARISELSKLGPYHGALATIVGLECLRRLTDLKALDGMSVCLFAAVTAQAVIERVKLDDKVIELTVDKASILSKAHLSIGFHEHSSSVPIKAISNEVASDLGVEMLQLTEALVRNKFAANTGHPMVTFAIRDAGNQWPMSDEAWRDIESLADVMLNVVDKIAKGENPAV